VLLKLVIPYYNRQFPGGVIARWHKAPGEVVQFGDDLLDIDVPEIRAMKSAGNVQRQLEALTRAPQLQAGSQNEQGQGDAIPAGQAVQYVTKAAAFMMGITASDAGVLRRILAPAGTECRVGDAVAILSTEPDEPLDGVEDVLRSRSAFRVVPNPFLPSS
jgi:biotin carboxyl carrier protein